MAGAPGTPGGAPSPGSGGWGSPWTSPSSRRPLQKEILAYEKWKQTEGFPAKADAFHEWMTALRESMKARKPLDPYYNDPMPPGPWPWGPKGAPPPSGASPGGGAPQTGPGGTRDHPDQPVAGAPGGPPPAGNCPGTGCPPTAIQKTQAGLGGVMNALRREKWVADAGGVPRRQRRLIPNLPAVRVMRSTTSEPDATLTRSAAISSSPARMTMRYSPGASSRPASPASPLASAWPVDV